MAKDEIVYKLAEFLESHNPLTEEAHVLYLMVEARKIIDQTDTASIYPLLKFYADWAVHSRKDKISPEIEAMSEQLYKAIVAEIASPYPRLARGRPPIIAFTYMDELAKEIESFLKSNGLENTLTVQKENWTSFVSLLVKVLENQPIVEPSHNVKTIVFEPTTVRFLVVCTIVFKELVKGRDGINYGYYTVKNVYNL